MEIKTVEFPRNGGDCSSRRVIRARAWPKHYFLSKVRNSVWFGREGQTLIYFGCRRDSQSRKKNVGEHVFLFKARGHFRTFGPTYDLKIFRLADPGCISFFRNNGKQHVFDTPGPPGTGAFRASDATSFSAAAPENGPFWIDSAARAPKSSAHLTNVAESSRGGPPQSDV